MGMIRRSSATSLAGWFILLAVLLSAVTRDGVRGHPQRRRPSHRRGRSQAPRTSRSRRTRHRRIGAVCDRPAPARGQLLDDLGQPDLGRDRNASGSAAATSGSNINSQLGTTEVSLRRPPGDAVGQEAPRRLHPARRTPHIGNRRRREEAHTVPTIAAIRTRHRAARKGRGRLGRDPEQRRRPEGLHRAPGAAANGGLFGNFELAWDAARGVPLHFADLSARLEHGRDRDHGHPHPLRPVPARAPGAHPAGGHEDRARAHAERSRAARTRTPPTPPGRSPARRPSRRRSASSLAAPAKLAGLLAARGALGERRQDARRRS